MTNPAKPLRRPGGSPARPGNTNAGALELRFQDDRRTVAIGDDLSFGREADLHLDSNPYLHREVGLLRQEDGVWRLHNTGTTIEIQVLDVASPNTISVAPGSIANLPFRHCRLVFRAGSRTYEVELTAAVDDESRHANRPTGSSAFVTAVPELIPTEKMLLVALAEPRLRDRSAPFTAIGSDRLVRRCLGWNRSEFHTYYERLCAKFAACGVVGVSSTPELSRLRQTQRLVDVALRARIVVQADLALLTHRPLQHSSPDRATHSR